MAEKGLPQGAWVVVADGEKALFLVNEGDAQNMNLTLRRKEEQDNPQAQDWATDRPGRMNDGGKGPHKSALEPTDWHQLEKERFAFDLADILYKSAHKGSYSALVIIASETVLGILRKELHSEVLDKIILDLPKVLTNHPLDGIEKAVRTALQDAA
jgi:protein required for attachment to host cells